MYAAHQRRLFRKIVIELFTLVDLDVGHNGLRGVLNVEPLQHSLGRYTPPLFQLSLPSSRHIRTALSRLCHLSVTTLLHCSH